MRHHFSRSRLGIFALLFAALLPLASEARAASVPFARWASKACPTSGDCAISFPAVPAARMWIIRYVSCYTAIGNVDGKILYMYLYANRKSGKRVGEIHLRPTSLGTSASDRTYNATETAYLPVPGGSTLGVTMTRDSSTAGDIPFLQCTIGGDSVPNR
jgi:hypothetical protein